MPSFDIVSELNIQEVDNGINQARKEVDGRYDFKGSKAEIAWDKDKKEITLSAEDEYKVEQMGSILQTKLHRRGVDIKAIKFDKIEPAGGRMLRQKVTLQQGIELDYEDTLNKLQELKNLKKKD
jgi:uncharacterized protein YajQ (UPF0234 family)